MPKGNAMYSAMGVIKKILGRKLTWFDYSQMDHRSQEEYYKKAQEILRSDVFNNEMKSAITDLVEHMATKSKDFEEVRDLRMTINGLELFRERLQQIENPNKKESMEDLDAPI